MWTRPFDKLYSVEHLKEYNQQQGLHFFEPATMRFFNSRISSELDYGHDKDGKQVAIYFVTSEKQSWEHDRLYTVRYMTKDGRTTTVGKFQQYASLNGAKNAMRRAAKNHAKELVS